MKYLLIVAMTLASIGLKAEKTNENTRVYELRVYHCNEGKREALIARFQNHTTRIFENHGMENVAYWLPTSPDMKNDLIYMLSYPSMEARDASWKAFMADPEWQKVWAESKKDGDIVATVDSKFLKLETELTKKLKLTAKSPERIFELRSYYCLPGRYSNIVARFRDHTREIFESHGMENIAYWGSIEKDDIQPHLVYIIAHKSEEGAKASWASFRTDPKWKAAQTASELDGKIVEKVVSVMMKPLPFSKLR
jgi:predicted nuclease of predicted toxin-antitoxin system